MFGRGAGLGFYWACLLDWARQAEMALGLGSRVGQRWVGPGMYLGTRLVSRHADTQSRQKSKGEGILQSKYLLVGSYGYGSSDADR